MVKQPMETTDKTLRRAKTDWGSYFCQTDFELLTAGTNLQRFGVVNRID